MIKLIVSDLDGTLFDETHTLNEATAAAIHKANAVGIQFMVATGRGKENVIPYLDGVGITCSKIVLNGAMFLNEKNEMEESVPMDQKDIRMIFELMESHGVVVHIFYSGGVACTDPEKMIAEFRQRFKTSEHMSDEEVDAMIEEGGFCRYDKKIDDLDTFLRENPNVYKMEAFVNDEAVIGEIRQKLGAVAHLDVSNSVGDNIEVTDVKAQKGTMLELVCEKLGIAKNEVITIGDSMNDLSMLRDFPHSYAMGNACDAIKAVAANQTGTNMENGVAQVIENVLAEQSR